MKKKRFSMLDLLIILMCVSVFCILLTILINFLSNMEKEDIKGNKKEENIGSITENLLTNNETYSYMNGTYLKGNVVDNYIWYNGFIWRIMGKNEDGSIRLITEENLATLSYGNEEQIGTSFENSYLTKWLNNYFSLQLKEESNLVESNFCTDDTIVSDGKSTRTTCNKVVKSKVGLISLDEYNLSGTERSYLNNGLNFGTLTSGQAHTNWRVVVGSDPTFANNVSDMLGYRAVLSLSPETKIISGKGTLTAEQDTEYVVKKEVDLSNSTMKDIVTVGEYVQFDGRTYRVLEVKEEGVRLILDDFTIDKSPYGTDFKIMEEFLQSEKLHTWLVPTREKDLLNTNWYCGESFAYGEDYEKNLSSKVHEYQGTIGISRMGELFTSQSLSILTQNYKTQIDSRNAKRFWTSTPNEESIAWFINGLGNIGTVELSLPIRPIITLSSNLKVLSGTGMLSNPYQV